VATTEAVGAAIAELVRSFGADTVSFTEDGEGGANVVVEGISLGGPWASKDTWVGFRINFTYPYGDIYPHFVRGDLARRDGAQALGEAMSATTFLDRQAIQISRRSSRRDPARETALIKLHKVVEWLRARP
jgi:hypothetical protein